MLTGSQIVCRALEDEGVDTVFGYPGGAVIPLYDALPGAGFHHVLVRFEQWAALAAEGYARATGKPGVCLATSGPGATNLVTGLADAMLDSVPIVAITGQVIQPLIGRDAFRTATGVHAAAVVKAWRKGDRELMDAVYSAIPASLVGREQEIDVGPMSGKSNVVFWLEKRGITPSDAVVDRVFKRAKASPRVLTEEEILAAVYEK